MGQKTINFQCKNNRNLTPQNRLPRETPESAVGQWIMRGFLIFISLIEPFSEQLVERTISSKIQPSGTY